MDIKIALDARPGEFYEVSGGFFLPIKNVVFATTLAVGPKLPATCMFDIYFMTLGAERVGFYFTSLFETVNGGSYLLTHLKGKGEATEADVLIKTDDLVVYNYPNRGTLAISPLVSAEIETIFQDQ